jgi:hypothetical protein
LASNRKEVSLIILAKLFHMLHIWPSVWLALHMCVHMRVCGRTRPRERIAQKPY